MRAHVGVVCRLGCEGRIPSADRESWPDTLRIWAERKFASDELPSSEILRRRGEKSWTEWESRAAADRLDGTDRTPVPNFFIFEDCPRALRPQAAPAGDAVTTAALQAIRPMQRAKVYRPFIRRLRGEGTVRSESWSDSILVLVPKPGKGHMVLENWRPICLVSTTFKWFDAYLWASLEQRLRPLPIWILGFRSGVQAMDLEIPRRAAEWGQPLLVASMDVQGAFEAMLLDKVGEQLHSRGATPCQVAAVLWQMVGVRVRPTVAGVEGPWVDIHRGARQGEARSPMCWNHLVVGPLEKARAEMDREWLAAERSSEISQWSLLVWADNLFVLSSSWHGLQHRCRAFLSLELPLSAKSLQVLPNASTPDPADLSLRAGPLVACGEIQCSGVTLDRVGSTQTMSRARARVEAVGKVWGRWRRSLASKGVPVQQRVHVFCATLVASAIWGSPL